MPINRKQLASSPYRDRFLAELQEHSEDVGGIDNLGNIDELIATFNMYALLARQKQALIIVSIAATTFAITSLNFWVIALADNPPPFWYSPISLLWQVLTIPILFIFYLFVPPLPEPQADRMAGILILLAPFLVAIFWSGIAALIMYVISKWKQKHYQN